MLNRDELEAIRAGACNCPSCNEDREALLDTIDELARRANAIADSGLFGRTDAVNLVCDIAALAPEEPRNG